MVAWLSIWVSLLATSANAHEPLGECERSFGLPQVWEADSIYRLYPIPDALRDALFEADFENTGLEGTTFVRAEEKAVERAGKLGIRAGQYPARARAFARAESSGMVIRYDFSNEDHPRIYKMSLVTGEFMVLGITGENIVTYYQVDGSFMERLRFFLKATPYPSKYRPATAAKLRSSHTTPKKPRAGYRPNPRSYRSRGRGFQPD